MHRPAWGQREGSQPKNKQEKAGSEWADRQLCRGHPRCWCARPASQPPTLCCSSPAADSQQGAPVEGDHATVGDARSTLGPWLPGSPLSLVHFTRLGTPSRGMRLEPTRLRPLSPPSCPVSRSSAQSTTPTRISVQVLLIETPPQHQDQEVWVTSVEGGISLVVLTCPGHGQDSPHYTW